LNPPPPPRKKILGTPLMYTEVMKILSYTRKITQVNFLMWDKQVVA
jgi:hypothetical protein